MKASVVIPSFNSAETLEECLSALRAQTAKNFDVVLVDDSSTDATQKALEKFSGWKELTVVRNSKTLGSSASRNIGWKKSKGSVVLFTDSDCVPEKNWVKESVKGFFGDGAVQGMVLSPERGVFTHFNEILGPGPGCQTSNLAVKKTVLEELGGFDERFNRFREDIDFRHRLGKAGKKFGFNPEAKVLHPSRERGFWGIVKFQKRYMNDPLLFKKHPQKYRETELQGRGFELHQVNRHRLVNFFFAGTAVSFLVNPFFAAYFAGAYYLAGVFGGALYLRKTGNAKPSTRLALIFLNQLVFLATWFWVWRGSLKFGKVIV